MVIGDNMTIMTECGTCTHKHICKYAVDSNTIRSKDQELLPLVKAESDDGRMIRDILERTHMKAVFKCPDWASKGGLL